MLPRIEGREAQTQGLILPRSMSRCPVYPSKWASAGSIRNIRIGSEADDMGLPICAASEVSLLHSARHKSFMSHSCRRSHCSFMVRGQSGESHGEEKEEEFEIEDLKRASL